MREFLFTSEFGKEYKIRFRKSQYQNNGNTAILAEYWDEEYNYWGPYTTVSVNLDGKLMENMAYLDTNNCNPLITWMKQQKFFTIVGSKASGFCIYPLAAFSNAFMEMLEK